jgi:hypothetical protein
MNHSVPEPLKQYLSDWFPEFGFHPRDAAYWGALAQDFPEVDLLEQLKIFHAWSLDRFNGKTATYRLSFRKWLSYASKRPPF